MVFEPWRQKSNRNEAPRSEQKESARHPHFCMAPAIPLTLLCALSLVVTGCYVRIQPKTLTKEQEEVARAKLAKVAAVSQLIYSGYGLFLAVEGRVPKAVSELCESPYIAVRCDDLKIEGDARSLLESLRGPKPWVSVSWTGSERSPSSVTIQVLRGDKAVSISEGLLHPPWIRREKIAQLSDPEKAGAAVEILINDLMQHYPTDYGDPYPATWQDLADAYNPIIAHLRNDFTGGYAVVSEEPSPGNLRVTPVQVGGSEPAPKFWVHVWGPNGKVIDVLGL